MLQPNYRYASIRNTMDDSDQEREVLQTSNEEDLRWLSKFKEGNRRAFDFFVRKYQRRLFGIIYNMTGNKEDTSDLLQDVFLKAFKAMGNFKGDSQVYTWLYRIATNTTLTFLQKNKLRRTMSLENFSPDDEAVPEFLLKDPKGEKGDKQTLLKELQEKLNEALQKLSITHRTVIVLFEIEGMNHAEIGKILGCSEGTVRSRLHYAKEQLKQLLKDYLEK